MNKKKSKETQFESKDGVSDSYRRTNGESASKPGILGHLKMNDDPQASMGRQGARHDNTHS